MNVLEAILRAKRPVLIAGAGCRGSESSLRKLADNGLSVSLSLLGLGLVPSNHPHLIGYHGFTGHPWANEAIQSSDCIVAVGTRLDVRQIGSGLPHSNVWRVDIDHEELRSGYASSQPQHTLFLDAGAFLTELADRMPSLAVERWWQTRTLEHPWQIDVMNEKAGDCVVVTGVGMHQHWVARHFDWDYPSRQLLTSGGHGAMGYDLPVAIGAAMHSKVLCIVGDGSLQMNIQELATLAEMQLPVKIFVLNNHRLGLVSQFQQEQWGRDPACGIRHQPDFVELARAYGIPSWKWEFNDEISNNHAGWILSTQGPFLIECEVPVTMGIEWL